MNHMDYKEKLETLRKAGFSALAIEKLCHFRRSYVKDQMDQAPADLSRMLFIRWLVQNGRLTDQCV